MEPTCYALKAIILDSVMVRIGQGQMAIAALPGMSDIQRKEQCSVKTDDYLKILLVPPPTVTLS